MTTAITVTIDDREVKEMLARLQSRLESTTPVMEVVGEIIAASVERNFEDGGRPAWEPSARVLEDGGQTLTDTGRLRRSITAEAGNGWAAVGTNVLYARIHQLGGTIRPKTGKALNTPYGLFKSVTIPARPFLMVQDEDWEEIHAAISDFLSDEM